MQAQRKFEAEGVVFLGLSPEAADEADEVAGFLDKYGITWPNGFAADATFEAAGVSRMPTLLVVGRDGIVTWSNKSSGRLEDAIERALAGS